ncbi:MAG: metal-dependent phosphohydrolase [Cyanobacteriota bacterium]|nr:metal-dependent phosphohydrolase [Cyanobacteriota bacterium]
MLSFCDLSTRTFIQHLQEGYRSTYGSLNTSHIDCLGRAAELALSTLARCDAAYHDAEHTRLVTLAGQEILLGKQKLEGGVAPETWLNSIVAWLFHDIGYVKGACRQDCPECNLYATGISDRLIELSPTATAASLTPHHVDRSKQFVREQFGDCSIIDAETIEGNIELTRFPVPKDKGYADTFGYAALTRTADLIGQLADPRYLEKLPALYCEFEETGANACLGCQNAGDLRATYPNFFWKVAHPYFKDGLRYLEATQLGKQIVTNLYANVFTVERELQQAACRQSSLDLGPRCTIGSNRAKSKKNRTLAKV